MNTQSLGQHGPVVGEIMLHFQKHAFMAHAGNISFSNAARRYWYYNDQCA